MSPHTRIHRVEGSRSPLYHSTWSSQWRWRLGGKGARQRRHMRWAMSSEQRTEVNCNVTNSFIGFLGRQRADGFTTTSISSQVGTWNIETSPLCRELYAATCADEVVVRGSTASLVQTQQQCREHTTAQRAHYCTQPCREHTTVHSRAESTILYTAVQRAHYCTQPCREHTTVHSRAESTLLYTAEQRAHYCTQQSREHTTVHSRAAKKPER